MKKNINQELYKRAQSFFPPELEQGYERILVNHNETDCTLVFVKNRLHPVKEMMEKQGVNFLKKYLQYNEEGYIIKIEKNTFSMYLYSQSYACAGMKVYTNKKSYLCKIKYNIDTKKCFHNIKCANEDFVKIFLKIFGLEAVINEKPERMPYYTILDSKTIIKGIITGKLTNFQDIWKTKCRTSFKIKEDFGLALEYYTAHIDYSVAKWSLLTLKEKTVSWQNSAKMLIRLHKQFKKINLKDDYYNTEEFKLIKDKENLIHDLLEDAFLLQKKVNLDWSEKRMNQEHLNSQQELMLQMEGCLDHTPIYEKADPFIEYKNLHMNLLNTEFEIYKEATVQNNCIYTHYCEAIKKHNYIGLNAETDDNGHITIGLEYNKREKQVYVDQAYGRFNQPISNINRELIKNAVQKHQEYFKKLFESPVPEYENNLTPTTDYLPF